MTQSEFRHNIWHNQIEIMCKLFDGKLSHFNTVDKCDRRTDKKTDTTAYSIRFENDIVKQTQ